MGKYEPLRRYLIGQEWNELPLTFGEIEAVLGFALPPSAFAHRAWWSNNPSNSVMTHEWLEAGFETSQVDMLGRKLVFRRRVGRAPPVEKPSVPLRPDHGWPPRSGPHHPAFGALRGLMQIMPGTDLTAPADPEWGERAFGNTDWDGRPWQRADDPVFPHAAEPARPFAGAPDDGRGSPDGTGDSAYALGILSATGNKSAVIRRLHQEGWGNARIARALRIRDQFVSNVVRAMR